MFFINRPTLHRQTINSLAIIVQLFFIIASFSAAKTFAYADTNEVENHERWYQVEMIIFSRAENNQQEAWPKNIKLAYPNNLVSLKSSGSDADGFSVLEPSERKLNSQAATIAKTNGYTLLFHQAWKQMIYGRKTHILINAGKTFNGHQELEGSIALSVSQYLKLQTDLWLTQFSPLNVSSTSSSIINTSTTDSWPELPNLHTMLESEKNNDAVVTRIVKINQQRSMRSVEIHYIDHPLLGIIIKIIPSDQPTIKANK